MPRLRTRCINCKSTSGLQLDNPAVFFFLFIVLFSKINYQGNVCQNNLPFFDQANTKLCPAGEVYVLKELGLFPVLETLPHKANAYTSLNRNGEAILDPPVCRALVASAMMLCA